MGKETTATFIGHKQCFGVRVEAVRKQIVKLIEFGVTDFLNGGMGEFDWMCAKLVSDLKMSYPQRKSYLVLPHSTFQKQNTLTPLSTQKALKNITSRQQFLQEIDT